MEQLLEAGQAIVDKQDPRSRTTSPIQQQVADLKNQWDTLKGQLDDREGKIDDVLRKSEHFHDILQDSSDWLIDFRNKISNLAPISNSPEVVRQQMEETKVLKSSWRRASETMMVSMIYWNGILNSWSLDLMPRVILIICK